jgi:hypothetical protein
LREAQARGAKAWAPSTATRCEYLLSLLSGSIGKLPIADIEPADVLVAVRRIEKKGKLESARRTLQLASAVSRYAVATARLSSDPTRDLRGALTTPTVMHYGAIAWKRRRNATDEYGKQGAGWHRFGILAGGKSRPNSSRGRAPPPAATQENSR